MENNQNDINLNSLFEKLESTLSSEDIEIAKTNSRLENNLLRQRRQRELQNLENEKVEAPLDNFFYNDGTPFYLDTKTFFYSWINYFAMIAAHDVLSTKNIDCLVYKKNDMKLDKEKTRALSHLLKSDQLEQKLYDLLEKAAINGYAGIAIIPAYNKIQSSQKYTLLSDLQIIRMAYLNNEIEAVQILANNAFGINVPGIWVYLTITKNSYQTFCYKDESISSVEQLKQKFIDFNSVFKKSININKKNLDKRAFEFLNNNMFVSLQNLNFEHNFGFVPFLEFKFNQNRSPIIKGIAHEMTEFFVIEQKKYDECHFSGTKILSLDVNPNNELQRRNLLDTQKDVASQAVILAKSELSVDDDGTSKPKIEIYTKNPIIASFHDASNAILNRILKKLGLSADTDSKGTVQQSKFEMLAQNQASFNFQNFRNVIFQNFIQKLIEMYYLLNFGDKEKIKAISSQSLGMTELDKMQYVTAGIQNQLFDKARAFSILTGKDYIDSSDILELQDLGNVIDLEPDLEKSQQTIEKTEF